MFPQKMFIVTVIVLLCYCYCYCAVFFYFVKRPGCLPRRWFGSSVRRCCRCNCSLRRTCHKQILVHQTFQQQQQNHQTLHKHIFQHTFQNIPPPSFARIYLSSMGMQVPSLQAEVEKDAFFASAKVLAKNSFIISVFERIPEVL